MNFRALLLTWLVGMSFPLSAWADGMIDTHMHFQLAPTRDFAGSLRSALATMDKHGIRRSLLMPPPLVSSSARTYYDIDDIAFVTRQHPDRFALLGGARLNIMIHETPAASVDAAAKTKFRSLADAIVAAGAVGFGEVAIHHVSIPAMGSQHADQSVAADHPLLLQLSDIAAELNLPIDLHFDLVPETMPLPDELRSNPLNPPILEANAEAFKRFLTHNPKTKIIWSHVGFEPLLNRQPTRVAALLDAFPNLYMSFRLNRRGPKPAAAIDPEGKLKPQWLELIKRYPERFMLGSDSFYDRDGISRGSSEEGLSNLRLLVESLPEPTRACRDPRALHAPFETAPQHHHFQAHRPFDRTGRKGLRPR